MKLDSHFSLRITQKILMIFIQIPAGEFIMGTNAKNVPPNEKPQHLVYLDEFWIGKVPVTNAQYHPFEPKQKFLPRNGNHPVVDISWDNANDYCAWLVKRTGCRLRLPTDAEWEKAARGTDGRVYPWGNETPTCSKANYAGCVGGTSLAGKYPQGASPYGILDMAGNVWEWTADWYAEDYYKRSPEKNPQGPEHGISRVIRGSSWDNVKSSLRTSLRNAFGPDFAHGHDLGFRCVLEKTSR
jgi:eukaryotic-like serine/threonine-protein kinase